MSAGTMLVWGGVLGWVTEWLLVVTRDGCRADHSSPTLASIILAHIQDTVIIYIILHRFLVTWQQQEISRGAKVAIMPDRM